MNSKVILALGLAIGCLNFNAVAQTWTKVSAPYLTFGPVVAMSADGCKLAATSSTASAVCTSADGGNTWQTNQSPGRGCSGIASSADGTKWIASECSGSNAICVSTNLGSNWTATAVPTDFYNAVSSSALGNILAAGSYTGFLYVSTNSGLTWTTNTSLNKTWRSMASSTDGTKLAAAAYQDKIYVSTNFGTTWTATQSTNDSWLSIACSADGTKLIASGNATYTSTNFGGQWTLANTNAGYVASSADGTKLIIAGGLIYTSSDSGAHWVTNNAPASGWSSVASSADGCELVAANYGNNGGIWIGRTTPSPQINMELAGNNLVLSWIMPSTNFVLQQSTDSMSANWVTLTNAPAFDPLSLQDQVTLLSSNASQSFFRLSAQ